MKVFFQLEIFLAIQDQRQEFLGEQDADDLVRCFTQYREASSMESDRAASAQRGEIDRACGSKLVAVGSACVGGNMASR